MEIAGRRRNCPLRVVKRDLGGLPVASVPLTSRPSPVLPLMMLRAAAVVPPTVLFGEVMPMPIPEAALKKEQERLQEILRAKEKK